jgi:Arc/MetJ family transcription regulator
MGQPTRSSVHVDALLTNISIAYIQDRSKYIATKIFPIIPVDKLSDVYFTYTKNDWFRDEAQRRGDSSESAGSGYNLTTASYQCDVYAFHKDIGDQTRNNADNPINLDSEATEFVTQRLLLRQERKFVADAFTTGVWGTDRTLAGTDQWSDFVNSDPRDDVDTAKEAILGVTGFASNTMVVGWQVWRQLKNHPDFREQIKYTSADNMTPGMVARMLEIDNFIIASSIYATNDEDATAAYSFNFGKSAWIGYVNPSPGLLAPSAGYTFAWNGVSGTLGEDVGISSIEMPLKKATRIEGEVAFDNKIVATDLGYFISAAVA